MLEKLLDSKTDGLMHSIMVLLSDVNICNGLDVELSDMILLLSNVLASGGFGSGICMEPMSSFMEDDGDNE